MITSSIAHPSSSPGHPSLGSPRDFSQILMKVQRATQRITSTLDFDTVLERVVTDVAATCVDELIAEVLRFSAGSEHADDATAVLIRSR